MFCVLLADKIMEDDSRTKEVPSLTPQKLSLLPYANDKVNSEEWNGTECVTSSVTLECAANQAYPTIERIWSVKSASPENVAISSADSSKETDNSVMEAIKSGIKQVLPRLNESVLMAVTKKLEEHGVEGEEDLRYVEEGDLLCILKPIQVRKLLQFWKNSGMGSIHTSTSGAETYFQIKPAQPTRSDIQVLSSTSAAKPYFKTEQAQSARSNQNKIESVHLARRNQKKIEPAQLISNIQVFSSSAAKPYFEIEPAPCTISNSQVLSSTSAAEPCFHIAPAQSAKSNIQVLSSNICQDWAYKFEIPWDAMPQTLMNSLRRSERPNPKLRREMIRIIVDHIHKICRRPLKKHMEILARKVVEKYPDSLQDRLNESVVGSGYCSFQRQLTVRSENLNRSMQSIRKKKSFNTDTTNASVTPTLLRNTYSCVNWQPEEPSCYDDKYTFYEQRCLINSGISLTEVMRKYPELMTEVGILTHFKELVNVDLVSSLEEGISSKGQRIFRYFHSCKIDRLQNIFDERENYEAATNCNFMNNAATIVHLIQTYFFEPDLFRFVEETALPHKIPCELLPNTPCLIVYGTSIIYSNVFALAIDQKILVDRILNFNSALAVLFASFYVFNMEYPEGASSTLEFIQRCFVNINCEEGPEARRRKNSRDASKTHGVSSKVLRLVNALANYEWLAT